MAETQVKEKDSKMGRRILIILIIIILLLTLFVGCFAQKLLHETNLKEQAKESAERYIKDYQLQFEGDVSIPMNLLKDANYLGYFDNKCLDASYVIVHKNGNKLEYEPIIICDSSKAILKLNGDSMKKLEVGEDYIEEGATIEGDSVHDVVIDNNVDTSKKGTYGVTYKIPDTDIPPVLRVVEVVDTTKPTLTLKNSDVLYLAVGDTYTEPGYKAIDNYDGDITDRVKITGTVNTKKAGTYTIIYKVTDSSNNTTEVTRQVIVRENVPTINLKGYATVYVDVFGSYTEEGYTATDTKGTNLTKQVVVSGSVNTSVVGEYVITYKVTSSNGATVTVRRTVKVVDNTKPEITLNGDKEVTLEWGKDTYVEMGATATDNYDGDISNRINITGIFNPNKLGTYYLAYTVTDASGNKSTVQRVIKVVDTEAPTITLKGNDPMYVEAGHEFVDPGVEASDNHDKNVTVEVEGSVNTSVLGNYTLTYTVTDASGNKTVLTRNVVVQDTEAPVITLKGESTVQVEFGTKYVEAGYTATDNYDRFVNNNVVVNGTVDVFTEGTYTLTYNVTDNNGNAATEVIRTVIVKDTVKPTVTLTSDDLNKFIQSANVTMKAFDTNHGLKSIYYAWKDVEPTDSEYAEFTYTENESQVFTSTAEGTYYLWIKAVDLSSNVTVEKIGPFKVDTTAPTITFTPNGAIAQNVAVTPSAADTFSGVKEIYYAWSNTNTVQPTVFTEYTQGALTQVADGEYYLWIKAVDNAGNEIVTVSNAFIVDNAYPSITFTYPTTSNVVKTAIVDVEAMGNSGKTITKVEYQWTKTSEKPTTGYTEWANYEDNHTITMPANLDGEYYLWIKATDSYGLVSYNSSRMITIDNTFPTITVTPDSSITPVQGIDINIKVVEDNLESILWAISQDSDINNVTLTESLTDLNSKISLKDLDGTYYLHIGVLDKAGNYTDYTSQAFVFDNTAPENPTISFDENWTKDPVEITITGTDTIEYSFDNKTWLPYNSTTKFTVSENTTIYAKATDEAGNVSEIVSKDVNNIDLVAPTLTITYDDELSNKLSVNYKAEDTNSGIDTIYYAWTTDLVEPTDFTETLTDAEGTVTKNDVNGTYALWIKVVDKAGNSTVKHTSLLELDKEAPVINITAGNGTTGPVTSQDTTVSITDDSDLTIEYIYTNTDQELENTEGWTSWYDYHKDNKNTLTLNNRSQDGIYYLHIKATDAAGNSTYVISNAFTLVNALPQITYNPATSLDYKQEISTIVTATLDGATIQGLYYAWSTNSTSDGIVDWTEFQTGDTISKNDVTGDYYLYIKVVDNVNGNRETIIKSTGTFNLDKTNVSVSFDPNGTGTPVREAETEIKASDAHSGINTIKYAWGTSQITSPDLSQFVDYELGTTIKKTTTNTFETYYLWVYAKDEAGNENYTVSEAFIIDNSYPTIDLDPNRSNPVNDLTVNITIDVDSNKTLTGIYYAWDTNSGITDNTVWTEWTIADYEANPTLTKTGLDGVYYLHVKVVDNNGLEATKSTYALEFDNTPADVTITPDTSNNPIKNIAPVITVTETNDYTVYYSFTTNADSKTATYTEWTDFMGQGNDSLTLGENMNGTYYLHVKVVDEAGNETYETATYVFDNEAPEKPVISFDTTWTNQDVEITITGTDIVEYSFDGDNWLTYDANNKPKVTTNKTTIYALSRDEAGNVSEIAEATIENIDKNAPQFTVTPSTTDWTNEDVMMDVDITDDNLSPIVSIRWASIPLTVEDYKNGRGFAVNLDTKRFAQGINRDYIEIYVEDAAGNGTIISTSVTNIDKTAPEIIVNPSDVTIDEGTTYDVLTGVSAKDNIGFGENELTYETDFDYTVPGVYTVTYTITDIAGNTTTATRTITVLDVTDPEIELVGDEEITIEVGGTYTEQGATATDNYDGDITANIEIDGEVDTNVVGTYTITYTITDAAGNSASVTRTVKVVDTTAPEIELVGDEEITIEVGTDYEEEGAIATDNYDGDITDNIEIEGEVDTETVGTYTITYTITDANGNSASVTRTVNVVDTTAPEIELVGDEEVTIELGDSYKELGATATDNYDGDITANIEVEGTVDTNVVGTYTITYTITDANGNSASVTRTVNVVDTTDPEVNITPDGTEHPVQSIKPVITVTEINTYKVYYSFTEEADHTLANYTEWTSFVGDDKDTLTLGENMNGMYYLHVKVVDAEGNTTVVTATYVFDNEAPEEPVISFDTAWTNQDVEVTIEGTDTIEYSFDGENWLTYDVDNKPKVTTNKTAIYARSKDLAGNISEIVEAMIENIDKNAPQFTVTPSTDEWTNQNITMNITITDDNLSPIVSIRWAEIPLTVEDYKNGRGIAVDLTTKRFVQGKNRDYVEIYVEDEAGNATIISTSVTNIDKEAPEISVDPSDVTIDEGTTYDVLTGVTIKDNVGFGENELTYETDFDYTVPGVYTITYSATDIAGNTTTATRTITVLDITAPDLELVGDEEITIEVGGTYTEQGATATDNVDGDITANIVIEGSVNTNIVDTYEITYTITDAAGNTSSITRTVNVVDTTDPEIELVGDEEITIEVGGTYTELGATATDNYDGDITANIEIDGEVDTTVVDTYEITYTITDANGNSASVTRTVNVVDTTDPEIELVGDEEITIEVGTDYEEEGAIATDNYDGDITDNIEIEGEVDTETVGTYTLTYTITDENGNSASVTRTVNVVDTTDPEIELVGDEEITIEVGTDYEEEGAIATDNYDGDITDNIEIEGEVDTETVGTYTLTYTITDENGNSASVTRTVNVVDTTAPDLELVGDEEITIEVGGTYTEQGATAIDNYDGDITANIVVEGSVDTTVVGTYEITYTITDENGNTASVTRTVNVVDTTDPEIELVGDEEITIEVGGTYIELGAIATDNYDGDITANIVVEGSVDTAVVDTYTITYTITDENGNSASVTRTVNVVDTTAPSIKLKGKTEITIEVGGTYIELGATATDNYDGDITANIKVAGNVFTNIVDTYTITYTITDENGNTASVTRTVNVVDTTAPEIELIGDETIELELGDTYVEQGATATDNYDGILTNEIEIEGSVDTAVVGTYMITYTVTDANGNTATKTRKVKVVDPNAPEIELIGDEEITIEAGSTYEELGAIATDDYDGDITANIEITGSVDTTVLGTYTITYSVKDSSGNSASVTRTVNVIDTTDPEIELVGDEEITIEVGTDYEELGATATDNLDGNITANIEIEGEVDTTVIGTYEITYTITDENGNSASVTRTVNVVDTTAPEINLIGKDKITIQAGSTYEELGATATDNYDGDITANIEITGSVDTTVLGVYTITYTVVDANGNSTSVTRTVNVVDTIDPIVTITGNEEITIEVGGTYTELGATATDNYDGDITANIVVEGEVDTTVVGIYTITYTVTDINGNTTTATRTINVVDTTAPEINLIGDKEITLVLGKDYVEPGYTATDNYDGDLTDSIVVKGTVNDAKVGAYTLTYTVTDANNNSVEITRTITVVANAIDNIFRDKNSCEEGHDCFSTPDTENNYFWYSGYLFRAYKSNADGSIKLITEGSIASLSYDDDSSIFGGSVVENWLNTTFYNSLHNADNFLIADKFCNLNTQDPYNNRTTCTAAATTESKVGLLSLFEYNLVGGKDSYLNNNTRFFTMTRYATKSVWAINSDGTQTKGEMVYNADAIRPVITIAAGIEAVEGDGTRTNPYRLANDTAASTNTALNDRYTGEYVKFNDQVWRIVSTDNNGTKLILDSYLKDAEGNIIEVGFGENVHYNVSNVLKEITSHYQNVNGLLNTVWYRGTYAWGQNPIGTSLRTEGNYSNYQYGLIRVGELMSGKSATLEMDGMTYWTMTENTENNTMWHISTTGGASYDKLSAPRAIRPVVKVNSNMTIVSGNGTHTSPYVIK